MRCFGYDESGQVILDSEAQVIHDCARRVLARESIPSILADLNHRGVLTSAGKKWSRQSLVRLLTNRRLSGAKDNPKILEPQVQEQVIATLEGQAGQAHGYGNQLKHLLVGFLVCGGAKPDGTVCGALLSSQPSNTGRRGYACAKTPRTNGCGRIRVQAEELEEHLVDQALAELASQPMRRRLEEKLRALAGDSAKVETALSALDERLAMAAHEYTHNELSMETLKAIERRVKAERGRLLDYRRRLELIAEVPVADVPALVTWWENQPLLRQRELLGLVLEKVIVKPATRRGYMHLDVDRIDPHWR